MNNKILTKDVIKVILIIFTFFLVIISGLNTKLSILMIGLIALGLLVTNKYLVLLLVIVLNEKLFYLFSEDYYTIQILSILITILSLYELLKSLLDIKKRELYWKNQILFIVIIAIVEAINSYILYKQNLILGIVTPLHLYRYLFYFYLALKFSNKTDVIRVENLLINISTFISIMYILQAIFYPNIIIFNMSYSIRNGFTRFYTGFPIIIFMFFITVSCSIEYKSKKFLIYSLIQLLAIILVCQTRNFTLGLLFTILCFILLQKRNKKYKYLFISLIFCICYLIIDPDNPLTNTITSVTNDLSNSSGTVGFRLNELRFYLNGIFDNLILGNGYFSSKFSQGYYILGRNFHYYTEDIGIIGFMFHAGLLDYFGLFLF